MLSTMQIELTNACNNECMFCSNRLSKRPRKDMNLKLLQKIIDEIIIIKPAYPVGICGMGEPTLHSKFNDAIEIISRTPFSIGTNAIDLTEDKIDTIVKYQFTDIVFSVDATTNECYKALKNNDNFDLAIEHIKLFLDAIRDKDKFWNTICLQFVYCDTNKDDAKSFIDYWLDCTEGIEGVKIYVKSLCPSPIKEANSLYPPPLTDLSRLKTKSYIMIDTLDKPIIFNDCELFKSFAMIMSDGTYSPCCMSISDRYKIGNINNMSIRECYESEKMQKYIEMQLNQEYDKLPFCRSCQT